MKILISSTDGSFFFDDSEVSLNEILLCYQKQLLTQTLGKTSTEEKE